MDGGVIGREEELAVARAFVSGLRDGPRGLVVEGAAGIGKTAVWQSTVEEAMSRGCRVLRCAAEEAEARLSFVGLSDLTGNVAEEVLAALPGPQRDAIDVALLRRRNQSGRAPDPTAVGAAVRSLLVELARAGPVVVAVDDLQWLDAATMRALAFAARRLDDHPVGILATLRAPLEVPDALGLERGLGADRCARLRLGPLSVGPLRVLLERRLGHQYRRPILLRIAGVADGNPLFALEIARALGPAPALQPGGPLPVPDSLREVVAARITALTPEARQSLLVAAALSHPSVEVVERASSAAGLAAAEEADLLRVASGRVLFSHPLYAAAVYALAASGRRRALHAQLAELVSDPEERVRHLALATDHRDEEVARALEGAAAHARARGAWEASGDLLEQAVALTSLDQPDTARRRGVQAAEHHMHAGDRPRARALLDPIVRDAPPGATRSNALRLLAEIHYHQESYAEAAELFEQALEHPGDRALAVRIELSLGYVRCNHLDDTAGGDAHAERGLAQARLLGDQALLGEALAIRAMVDFMDGRRIDWSQVEQSLTLEDTGRLLPLELRPSMIVAQLNLFVGRLAEARERLTALRLASIDSGDESDVAVVLVWLAWLETLSGNLRAAALHADEAAVQTALTGSERDRAWVLAQRSLVHAHRGEAAAARADAAAATEVCTRLRVSGPMLWVSASLGVLELSLGDPRAAWSALAPLAERCEARGVGPIGFLADALEALIALDELDRAGDLLEKLERRGRELDRAWALAAAARCRGLWLAAQGDLDQAEAALDAALVRHERMDMPFALARTLLVQGQVRRRRRERRAARESLERALARFEEMGAPLWADRTRGELARLGSRRAPGRLTATERRVVELAADGYSNKEIAGTLFVSVHTVEAHLTHAYAKLGVHSRTQLAGRLSAT
jgi:DNA-binding CsgD family transcriptional regulator